MIGITQAIPLSEHRLSLQFSDGMTGIVDLAPFIQKGVFRVLMDEKEFHRVTILYGTVRWDEHNLDIAPEYLYKLIVGRYPEDVEAIIRKNPIR